MTTEVTIVPRGPFSLRAAAGFGFGPNEGRPPPFDGVMRLAFALDGGAGYAAVALRQESEDGPVHAAIDGDARIADRQAARVLSLDHDGSAFVAVGERDRVLGALQRAHPGQRPVLFHSPYEAAAWSVISARRPASVAAAVRRRIAEQLGESFEVAGERLAAFPQPDRLAAVEPMAGLPEEKVMRLRGIADAAADGLLDAERLQALGPERATEEVQTLRGIGPFYAGLIVLRGSGFADAGMSVAEPKVLGHAARLYGHDGKPTLEWFTALAEGWRPFRTWATVLVRLAGDRCTAATV